MPTITSVTDLLHDSMKEAHSNIY